MANHLLPKGFPDTVAPSYTQYAAWSAAGSVASSAAGVLSMQALLHAVGAGAGAIPMAAALQWVLKDGLGQLGGVLFTSFVSTRFDSDAKRWRFVSAIALEAATLLEVLTPAAPALFLPMAAAANVGKNISWLSASATRAGIHQALSLSGNLADVTGKAGSQSIAASLVGTAAGIGLSTVVGSATPAVLAAWSFLAAIHLGSLYTSLKGLSLPMLSNGRAEILARSFWNQVDANSDGGAERLPSPDDIRTADNFVGPLGAHLVLGQPLQSPIPLHTNPDLGTPSPLQTAFVGSVGMAMEAWQAHGSRLHERYAPRPPRGRAAPCSDVLPLPVIPAEDTALPPHNADDRYGSRNIGFVVAGARHGGSASVGLWIEAGTEWWVQLAGHLAAVRLQLLLEQRRDAGEVDLSRVATSEALEQFGDYADMLDAAGWWLGHPMLETDKTRRLRLYQDHE